MKTIKGPALFLGQFAGDAAPFDSWDGITRWAAECGYVGVQVPTWAGQLIDLKQAAASQLSMKRSSEWSPPSVALMKAKSTPEARTRRQSMSPWYLETSMPWTGYCHGTVPDQS